MYPRVPAFSKLLHLLQNISEVTSCSFPRCRSISGTFTLGRRVSAQLLLDIFWLCGVLTAADACRPVLLMWAARWMLPCLPHMGISPRAVSLAPKEKDPSGPRVWEDCCSGGHQVGHRWRCRVQRSSGPTSDPAPRSSPQEPPVTALRGWGSLSKNEGLGCILFSVPSSSQIACS